MRRRAGIERELVSRADQSNELVSACGENGRAPYFWKDVDG